MTLRRDTAFVNKLKSGEKRNPFSSYKSIGGTRASVGSMHCNALKKYDGDMTYRAL